MDEKPKDTKSIKPKLPITPKDKSLDFKYNKKLDFIFGRIPQIVFIESCISAKTEVAPTIKVIKPIVPAKFPSYKMINC